MSLLKRSLILVISACWSTFFSLNAFAHGSVSGKGTAQRIINFPDTEKYQTLVVDMHTHSVFSDGHVWPNIRVAEALKDGLDALAITEHLEYQPHRADIPHPDRNQAYLEAKQAAEGTDLIVIAGSEITRDMPAGHINAVFISDANALLNVAAPPAEATDARGYYDSASQWPAQAAVDAAAAQGAFLFWNHPYWSAQTPNGIAQMNEFHSANIKAGKLHGIEIANGKDYSAEAHQIALEYDLALMGVSDVHNLIDWDYNPHTGGHRPVNLVLATEKSAAAIKQAMLAKRSLVWFKNLLIGRKPEMDALLGASMKVTAARYRSNTSVLDVTISNHSDAVFQLQNLSDVTFMDHANRINIAANADTQFSVKPGSKVEELSLVFSVENALLTPDKHPTITFDILPTID